MLVRGLDDAGCDRGVHGVEVVAAVVQQVERLELDPFPRELFDGGMARRAHVAHRNPFQRGACRGQQQVDAGRAEADDDDARPVHPPAGTVVVVLVAGAHAADFSRQVRTAGTAGGDTPRTVLPLWGSVCLPHVP